MVGCGGCGRLDVPVRPGAKHLRCAHVCTSGIPCISSHPQVHDSVVVASAHAIFQDSTSWDLT